MKYALAIAALYLLTASCVLNQATGEGEINLSVVKTELELGAGTLGDAALMAEADDPDLAEDLRSVRDMVLTVADALGYYIEDGDAARTNLVRAIDVVLTRADEIAGLEDLPVEVQIALVAIKQTARRIAAYTE